MRRVIPSAVPWMIFAAVLAERQGEWHPARGVKTMRVRMSGGHVSCVTPDSAEDHDGHDGRRLQGRASRRSERMFAGLDAAGDLAKVKGDPSGEAAEPLTRNSPSPARTMRVNMRRPETKTEL